MKTEQVGGAEAMVPAQVSALYSSVYPCTALSMNCVIKCVQVQHMETGQYGAVEDMVTAEGSVSRSVDPDSRVGSPASPGESTCSCSCFCSNF